MAIRDNIQQNVESYEEHSGLIEDGNQDTEEGGIDLLGQDDADQQAGMYQLMRSDDGGDEILYGPWQNASIDLSLTFRYWSTRTREEHD